LNKSDANLFVCPRCHGPLRLLGATPSGSSPDEIEAGRLVCESCAVGYPIVNSIPRFLRREGDEDCFGFQWNAFARVQTSPAHMPHNRDRFFATTGWSRDLGGETILEAGCGAGRFSGVALETGAEIFSFDLSSAVEAARKTAASPQWHGRHHLFQADIAELPLPRGMFDKIFCMGVLQHCADVKKAYLGLIPFLKPGGEIAAECYWSQPLKHFFNLKYWLRPLFKWWKPALLVSFWTVVISLAYDLKACLAKIPGIGERLAALVPIGRLNFEPEMHLSVKEIKEIKTLSVVDMLGPKYDQPKRLSDFEAWTREAGAELLHLGLGHNGINIRARRPVSDVRNQKSEIRN
jgi:SAM-dependent methyltransferase